MARTATISPTRPLPSMPDWPTQIKARLSGGRVLGVDNSVWMYYAVPMSPVADAKNAAEMLSAAEPLQAVFEELAGLARVVAGRRAASRKSYRQTHTLLINLPRWWRPRQDDQNHAYLAESFPSTQETRLRTLMFGVRLADKVGGSGGVKDMVSSVLETMVSGGVPLSDYDADAKVIADVFKRSGLREVTAEEWRIAGAWWNQGASPDAPMLVQPDCLHVYSNAAQVSAAASAIADGRTDDASASTIISMATVQDLDLPWVSPLSSKAQWASELVDLDALAISIRGAVEPAQVTAGELRRNRRRYEEDMRERAAAGKMERSEHDEQTAILAEVGGAYERGGPATLTDTSIVVGFSGYVPDMAELSQNTTAKLNAMLYRQREALYETMVGSSVRANPHLHDLPNHVVAGSGLPSLSVVGDDSGALVGWSKRDKQAAYMSHMAASDADTTPIFVGAGATGSGKTMFALSLADQWARSGIPVVFVDPKTGSDHSPTVLAAGGQVVSLDDLDSADGVFDPIRFSATPSVGVDLAASLLISVNPWGSNVGDLEAPLQYALHFGVERGATCTGEALLIAAEHGHIPKSVVDQVVRFSESSPMFRACFGVKPGSQSLRVSSTITLIKVGNAHLELPTPGSDLSKASLPKRVGAALVRMMVFGSAAAVTGRDGVVMLDEAWVFLQSGMEEVERLGRLARSQRVLPMLFTQRISDAVKAGLSNYISRGIILPIKDPDEAIAACELFDLEPTEERIRAITAEATIGAAAGGTAPNWGSMRALRDPVTRKVIRGTIGIYADLAKRAVPVQIDLSPIFLELASTNAKDILERKAKVLRAQELAERVAREPLAVPEGVPGW